MPDTEERIRELLSIVKTLDADTREAILESLRLKLDDAALRRQVLKIQTLAKATDAQIRAWLLEHIPREYVDGINIANKKLHERPVSFETFQTSEEFLQHRTAMNILLKESYLDFGNTMVGVVKGAERILNDAARRQVRGKITAGELAGSSVREIAKDVQETLAQQGFSVLIDRGGRQWTLPNYSEMLSRTHLIKTSNEGVVNRMTELGADIVQVSETSPNDDVCRSFNERIFSISGRSEKYPKLTRQPPFHPNCRGALLPRPDLDE